VADRVVMAAAKIVLEPIFEADFHPSSYDEAAGGNPGPVGYAVQSSEASRRPYVGALSFSLPLLELAEPKQPPRPKSSTPDLVAGDS